MDTKSEKSRFILHSPLRFARIRKIYTDTKLFVPIQFILTKKKDKHKGDVIYLKKKRKKAPKQFKKRPHIVQPGESMYSISQKYGIRLKSLYSKNHLDPDFKIYPGARLKVR